MNARFVDNCDGTVTDTWTGLMWTKATVARSQTHGQATDAVKQLDVGGFTNWRLPNDHELLSLVDRSRYRPAIDTEVFPNTENDWYWTNTLCAWDSSCAWVVYFDNGYADYDHRSDGACVRAVRSGPAGQSSLPSALSKASA